MVLDSSNDIYNRNVKIRKSHERSSAKSPESHRIFFFFNKEPKRLNINVREKIRTPDLLVRSQTLYPAELRAHAVITRSQRNLVYNRFRHLSSDSGKKVKKSGTA